MGRRGDGGTYGEILGDSIFASQVPVLGGRESLFFSFCFGLLIIYGDGSGGRRLLMGLG